MCVFCLRLVSERATCVVFLKVTELAELALVIGRIHDATRSLITVHLGRLLDDAFWGFQFYKVTLRHD